MSSILRTKLNIWGRNKGKKVFVGLSGGVDSAVSAALLQKEGYDITGVFIKIQIAGYPCPAGVDRRSAMRVAAHLRIPFMEIDLSREYEQEVLEYSLKEFARGRTPNPDALCNREIKFGKFFEFAKAHGADFVATGHYARLSSEKLTSKKSLDSSRWLRQSSGQTFSQQVSLLTSTDSEKDQSYFLWAVPENHLAETLFPIGDKTKPEVRKLAEKFGLPNAARPDSQGLCFLGDLSIDDLLHDKLEPKRGNVLNESGDVVGTHEGAILYTLGQRHGFTLHEHSTHTQPHYVIGKDVEHNTIMVSDSKFPRGVQSARVSLREINWIGGVEAGACEARFRYRQKLIPAELIKNNDTWEVLLKEPYYVPLGQSLVLYKGARCLGGGVIESATLG